MQWYMKWKRSLQDNEANLSMNEGTKGAQFSMLSLVSILQPPLCHDRDPTPKHRHGRQGKVGKRFALYYLCYLHQLCYWKKKKTNSCSEVQQIEGPHSGDLTVWHFEGSRPLLISNITLQLLESLSLIILLIFRNSDGPPENVPWLSARLLSSCVVVRSALLVNTPPMSQQWGGQSRALL